MYYVPTSLVWPCGREEGCVGLTRIPLLLTVQPEGRGGGEEERRGRRRRSRRRWGGGEGGGGEGDNGWGVVATKNKEDYIL